MCSIFSFFNELPRQSPVSASHWPTVQEYLSQFDPIRKSMTGAIPKMLSASQSHIPVPYRIKFTARNGRTRDAITTPLLRQNDVAMSFWRINDVIVTSCVTVAVWWYPTKNLNHCCPRHHGIERVTATSMVKQSNKVHVLGKKKISFEKLKHTRTSSIPYKILFANKTIIL